MAAAARAVELWSGIWRTRRLLLAGTDRCEADDAGTESLHQGPLLVCPHVRAALAEMARFEARGDQVVLIGRRFTAGRTVHAPTTVESAADVPSLTMDPEHVTYLVQPGMVIEDAAAVIAALRARYPRIKGAHPDGLCYVASDRRSSIRAVAESSDVVLALGATHDVETRSVLAGTDADVYVIEDPSEIEAEPLRSAECVGLVLGANGTAVGLREMIDILSGLGPVSLAERRVTTTVLPADDGFDRPGRSDPHRQPETAST